MGDFGAAVRQARIERGLSQAELGEPLFSRSYVSLVETGRRAPSHEVVEHFAARLGLSPAVLRSWALAQGDSGTTRAALAQAAVFSTMARSAYLDAGAAASELGEFALGADRLDLWWTAAMVQVEAGIESGDTGTAIARAEKLLDHWFTAASPALTGRVLTALATALRLTADYDRAIDCARRAVDHLTPPAGASTTDGRAEGLAAATTALVSALADAGRITEALGLEQDLREAVALTPSRVHAAKAHWTLGNLAFLRGDPVAGVADHDRAAELIDPDRDLRNWARLHRASASMRIKAGADLDAVPALLEKARAAFGISAGPGDLAALAVVQGRYAAHVGDHDEAAARFEEALGEGEHLAAPVLVEAHQSLADALRHLGDHEGAAAHLSAALEILTERLGSRAIDQVV